MGMHTYYKAKDMLCEELDNLVKQGDLNNASLDMMDKLTHSIKSLSTIIAMEEYDDENSERGYSYARRGGRRGGMSYDDMRMEGGTSYARRDRRGRYSRDEDKDELMSKLEKMAMTTNDERMKSAIHKCIDELEKD